MARNHTRKLLKNGMRKLSFLDRETDQRKSLLKEVGSVKNIHSSITGVKL